MSFMLWCFCKFHIRCKFAFIQKLSNTAGSLRPANELCIFAISGRTTRSHVNPILRIPDRNAASILLDTITAMINFSQKIRQFFDWFLFHKLRSNFHTAIHAITSQHQKMIYFFLRKRKSRELFALCFIYHTNLFILCKEEIETQLLISSCFTTSSACAFRLFMCCVHPIWSVALSGAGFCFRYSLISCSTLRLAVSSIS